MFERKGLFSEDVVFILLYCLVRAVPFLILCTFPKDPFFVTAIFFLSGKVGVCMLFRLALFLDALYESHLIARGEANDATAAAAAADTAHSDVPSEFAAPGEWLTGSYVKTVIDDCLHGGILDYGGLTDLVW